MLKKQKALMEIELLYVIFVMKAVILALDQKVANVLDVRKDFSTTKDLVFKNALLASLQIGIQGNAFHVLRDVRFAQHRFITKKVDHFIKYVRIVKRVGSLLETLP